MSENKSPAQSYRQKVRFLLTLLGTMKKRKDTVLGALPGLAFTRPGVTHTYICV